MLSSPITSAVIDAYAKVAPQDVRDGIFYLSEATARQLREESDCSVIDTPVHGSQIFGRPSVIDDNLPFGVVHFLAETELDRVIRRATAAGRSVNIVKPVDFLPTTIPVPPTPTLKALLKHWMRKCRIVKR